MSYSRTTRPARTTTRPARTTTRPASSRGRVSPASSPYIRARPSQHHSGGAVYQSGGAMNADDNSSLGYQGGGRALGEREPDVVQPETNGPGVERSLQR